MPPVLTMAERVSETLGISILPLAKPKPIKGFDGRPAPPITHAIYPTLIITEYLAPFLIMRLGQHPLMLGKPWMRKQGAILDMSCDQLTFWPGHCTHLCALISFSGHTLFRQSFKLHRLRSSARSLYKLRLSAFKLLCFEASSLLMVLSIHW